MAARGGGGPTFRSLTHAACDALLARNHVGRLAFALHDGVNIQPIHYVYEAGWIYGRTSEGAKLTALAHRHWVAFEVDEVRGVFDWQSVVARGTFHRVDPEGSRRDQGAGAHAIHLLQRIVPETFMPDDPVPSRRVLFRISLGEVSGRAAIPATVEPSGSIGARREWRDTPGPAAPPDRSGW